MNDKRLFSRRKFLIRSTLALGGTILAGVHRLLGIPEAVAQEPTLTPWAYLPIIFGSGQPLPKPRVVHVRDAGATNWNGTDLFYNSNPGLFSVVRATAYFSASIRWPRIASWLT